MYRIKIVLLFAILASATLTASTAIADSPPPIKEEKWANICIRRNNKQLDWK